MTNPTPEEIRQFLAGCNLRRHGWARFQQGNRRSAARILAKHESAVNGTGAQGSAFAGQPGGELGTATDSKARP